MNDGSDDLPPEMGDTQMPDDEALVTCPNCGESLELSLDPGGGALQEYVEDCSVCCAPFSVRVRYDGYGGASVTVAPPG
jgi:hypothetical protein